MTTIHEARVSEERLFGAVLVQPFLAGIVAFAMFPVYLLDGNGRALAGGVVSDTNDAAMGVAFFAAIIAGLLTLLGVLPLTLSITKRRQITFPEALLFGVGFGTLPYFFLTALARRTYGANGALRGMAFSATIGIVCAAAFWFIALRRVSSRD